MLLPLHTYICTLSCNDGMDFQKTSHVDDSSMIFRWLMCYVYR